MPDPTTHTQVAAPLVGGVISSLIAMLFDIEADILLVAFIGAWVGIALRDAVPEFSSKLAAMLHFFKTLGVVILGTISAAYCIPVILKHAPDIATQRSVAAFTGFGLVYFYAQIMELLKFSFGMLKGIVSRMGGKVGE